MKSALYFVIGILSIPFWIIYWIGLFLYYVPYLLFLVFQETFVDMFNLGRKLGRYTLGKLFKDGI